MSHKKLRPFIVKVSVLGYFPLPTIIAVFIYIYIYIYIIKVGTMFLCVYLIYLAYIFCN